jgi:hypothetical protein
LFSLALDYVIPSRLPQPAIGLGYAQRVPATAALKAAIDLDLFTEIGAGNNTAAALALACSASVRGIRILCDYLTVIGLHSKSVDGYSLNATSATFLDTRSPAAMNSVSRFVNSPQLMAGFDNLTETVRQGTTQLLQQGCIAKEYDGWVTFSEAMTPIMREASILLQKRRHGMPTKAPSGYWISLRVTDCSELQLPNGFLKPTSSPSTAPAFLPRLAAMRMRPGLPPATRNSPVTRSP